jgi:hypothetical protein
MTFDLPNRAGILVLGELLTGVIQGETMLRVESTDEPIRVLGVEIHSSAGRETLLIDRAHATAIRTGTVLISPA